MKQALTTIVQLDNNQVVSVNFELSGNGELSILHLAVDLDQNEQIIYS